MKLSLLALAALALPAALAGQAQDQAVAGRAAGCVYCHSPEATQAKIGIHQRSGIDCVACHNGDPQERADARAAHGPDFAPLGDPVAAVESCGRCHADPERMAHFGLKTDQLALYRTSSHGKALYEGHGKQVATCMDCHGTHRVLPVSDPRSEASKLRLTKTCMGCHEDRELMSAHGVNATAPADYRGSVHGRELLEKGNLASPGCVDCHGSHGAAPPRMGTIEMVCGHCHTPEREQFRKSPHFAASQRGEMSECTSCHANHAVEEIGPEELIKEDGLCAVCHQDPGEPARRVAREIHDKLLVLEQDVRKVEAEVAEAALRGLFLRDHVGFVDELRSLRRSSAPVTHASSQEVLEEVVKRGDGMVVKTNKSLEILFKHLRDLRYFAALFLFVCILLTGLLLYYRREL
ncbi:MAG: cytochrome c3 family protein [Planctomycetes bacterium]|nr:cytochrome c3 family protein [Planctomycetota bacterium]MBL7007857.1 cytochrome c3 family protein [Planctomycetota bacterium]